MKGQSPPGAVADGMYRSILAMAVMPFLLGGGVIYVVSREQQAKRVSPDSGNLSQQV